MASLVLSIHLPTPHTTSDNFEANFTLIIIWHLCLKGKDHLEVLYRGVLSKEDYFGVETKSYK